MKNYEEIYKSKLVSIDDILGMIKSENRIILGNNALLPFAFLKALPKLKGRVQNVYLYHTGFFEEHEFLGDIEMRDTLKVMSSFSDGFAFKHHDLQMSNYLPCHMYNGTKRMIEAYEFDFQIAQASGMDRFGNLRFSLNNFNERVYADHAKKVILEVNKNLPLTNGTVEIPIDQVDYIVEVDYPVLTIPNIPYSDVEEQIGRNVAALVQDGSTIQLGIGGIPNAVGAAFKDKNHLGVHTEMITSVIQELAQNGNIDGSMKTVYKGKIIGTFALGSQELYDYIDENPAIWLMDGEYVVDRSLIMKNYRMVSVNTALQVDLFGQVNSESLMGVQYSGTGGAADFAYGATNAKEGKAIIAIRSTARKGSISTIQPHLDTGSIVSVSRNDLDYIVTEYGAALMRTQTVRERMENLINVAHPNFRDELRQKAKELRIW